MKNCLPLIAILLLSSCDRTYTCQCDGGALGNGITISMEHKTKEEAKKECDANNSGMPLGYHSCKLK